MSTYLLVHGAFCGGWVWDEVTDRLAKAGCRAKVVEQLPSAGADPHALGDLDADVHCVRGALGEIEEPVVLVGHSYGGVVITELADHPKVQHSVYLTALWPERGQSAMGLFGNVVPPPIIQRADGALGLTDDFELAWEKLCGDVDREFAATIVSRFLPQSFSSFTTPCTAPERTHPATYIIAVRESELSVAAQEAAAGKADSVVRLSAAHMVQLSRPQELVEALIRV